MFSNTLKIIGDRFSQTKEPGFPICLIFTMDNVMVLPVYTPLMADEVIDPDGPVIDDFTDRYYRHG
jgi:hypothetical protein